MIYVCIELKSGGNYPNVDLYDPILDVSECVSRSFEIRCFV